MSASNTLPAAQAFDAPELDPEQIAMLRSLRNIAEAIDAAIVAEGIETREDLEALKELGIGYGQGYYLARPGPPFPEVTEACKAIVRGEGPRADPPLVLTSEAEEADEHEQD